MSDETQPADYFTSNAAFDSLYPERIQQLSRRHWTPLGVAKKAAQFLAVKPGGRILDIGSGVGKFCLVGGFFYPDQHFYGVEQREDLINQAEAVQAFTGLENVSFIHGDFTRLDVAAYDHFYFYNSFYEHLVESSDRIDDTVDYSEGQYNFNAGYLFKALASKPEGTRVMTFHSLLDDMPPGYRLVYSSMGMLLRGWIKM
ncbi:methyltransferase domain-containing protein [Chitinophaga agrisoli]|uniref:Methyltransferase domain-containing protein n=1 Tax=Chitinophaga agrisoli TaxID=2607653 RepID=A0A5B2VPM0_9BACT|nr:methyltransferase domain-containing protein [Chitinophaga agrisoli]KAA2241703.1 methyltransferase domain-containing protein [Chitinophaga agrisoli]